MADETKVPVAPKKKPLVPRVRLSGHFSDDIWFGFLCAPVSCAMGIASEGSLEKIAILTLKARSHVRILIHIERGVILKKIFHITNYLELGDSGAIG